MNRPILVAIQQQFALVRAEENAVPRRMQQAPRHALLGLSVDHHVHAVLGRHDVEHRTIQHVVLGHRQDEFLGGKALHALPGRIVHGIAVGRDGLHRGQGDGQKFGAACQNAGAVFAVNANALLKERRDLERTLA